MKLVFLEIGKTKEKATAELVDEYAKRVKRYHNFEIISIKEARLSKNSRPEEVRQAEADAIRRVLLPGDQIVLLDEKGTHMSSRGFARFLQNQLLLPKSRLVFVIGGAWGFHNRIYELANEKLALSKMTMSHQIVRPVFMEQLYRAFTIINKHPYHND